MLIPKAAAVLEAHSTHQSSHSLPKLNLLHQSQRRLQKRRNSACFCHLTTLPCQYLLAGMNACENAEFALVIAEPEQYGFGSGPDPTRKWQEFLANIQNHIPPSVKVLRIHENVWQIPLNTEMRTLTQLFDWSHNAGIRLRILFLDEEPDWIEYPPVEKPKEEAEA